MGKFEDYINSLDGKDDLNVIEVVAEMAKLHNEEISTSTAKIASLSDTLAERDSVIAEKENEIKQVKSANWDLVNQIPTNKPEADAQAQRQENGLPDSSNITLDDVFEK